MKHPFNRIVKLYFSSWWFPPVLFLASLVFSVLLSTLDFRLLGLLVSPFWAGGLLLVLLIPGLWHLRQKRWLKGGIFILGIPLAFTIILYTTVIVGFSLLFGFSSDDHFAKNLEIPQNIEISTPLTRANDQLVSREETLQSAILKSLQQPGSQDSMVTATVANLMALHQQAPDILWQYLTMSPAWRVYKERGTQYATHLWQWEKSNWQSELNRSCLNNSDFQEQEVADFQVCFALESPPNSKWYTDESVTHLSPDAQKVVSVAEEDHSVGRYSSQIVITMPSLALEILEQSPTPERVLSKTVLAHLEQDLTPLVESPTIATIRTQLSKDGLRTDKPSIELWHGSQPGIYTATIWINPGEPGHIYLKAFEVTQGTQLSEERLKRRSHEWVGWSDNPEDVFLANSRFTIYEGDWGDPYAARFEVWFTPDAGGSDRKLLERVFKIEGWQR